MNQGTKGSIFTFFILLIFFSYSVFSIENKKNTNYCIQPGDILKISVLDENDLTCEVKVSSYGNIIYPLLGKVKVVDKDISEVSELLTKLLKEYIINPIVSVYILTYSKIYIYGKVAKPGAYELSQRLTVLQAISLAGGLKDEANPKKITIKRHYKDVTLTTTVDLTEITQKKISTDNSYVQPNDIIIVPESFL